MSLTNYEKLKIIKAIEDKASQLKSPKLNEVQESKLEKFEQYKQAYQTIKTQDPKFKIPELEPKIKHEQFNLDEWILNHYTSNDSNKSNNNQGDIKI